MIRTPVVTLSGGRFFVGSSKNPMLRARLSDERPRAGPLALLDFEVR